MSNPNPIDDAQRIIDADPLLSAVSRFSLGFIASMTPGNIERHTKAALVIVASRAPTEPHTYTRDEAAELYRRTSAALDVLDATLSRDDAAAMGDVQRAARALAALVGGARV